MLGCKFTTQITPPYGAAGLQGEQGVCTNHAEGALWEAWISAVLELKVTPGPSAFSGQNCTTFLVFRKGFYNFELALTTVLLKKIKKNTHRPSTAKAVYSLGVHYSVFKFMRHFKETEEK